MGAVLTLGCDMIPKINFAMQQNYIPFIRNLTVGNEGDEDIDVYKRQAVMLTIYTKNLIFTSRKSMLKTMC